MLFKGVPDSLAADTILRYYRSVRYDIKALSFDPETRTFGQPEMVEECSAAGKSAAVPRVSPDGRYVLYALADFGQFHIWHQDSDLWIKDLATGEARPLVEANSESVESYHGWSSNGRWIVFASRRLDKNYSRVFIAYFDKDGRAHKAFVLPQENPDHDIMLMKSYNVPELSRSRVSISPQQFRDVICADDKIKTITYSSK